jgi:hypothetical protein
VTTFEWNLCNRIWRLVKLEWEVWIRHTYREENMCGFSCACWM